MLVRTLLAATLLASMAAIPTSASAEELSFRARSSHPDVVSLEFRSTSRSAAWPGNNTYYKLEDDEYHSINIRCQYGEQVCYGAWVTGENEPHWGRGRDGRRSCSHCCYTCDGSTHTINLSE